VRDAGLYLELLLCGAGEPGCPSAARMSASRALVPCLAAVARYERMAQNCPAPVMLLMHPETLIRILPMRISRSAAWLLVSDPDAVERYRQAFHLLRRQRSSVTRQNS
jgi:hypothetical protein